MISERPTSSSGTHLHLSVGLAVAVLLVTGGLIAWKLTRSPPSSTAVLAAEVTRQEPPVADAPPPPPPPEDEPTAAPSRQTVAAAPPTPTQTTKSPCAVECTGTATAALRSALGTRGVAGRRCYEKWLAQDPSLRGKMTVHVKVSPSGQLCVASVSEDTIGNADLVSCILTVFRAAPLPPPQGGCVDADIPLNFVPNK